MVLTQWRRCGLLLIMTALVSMAMPVAGDERSPPRFVQVPGLDAAPEPNNSLWFAQDCLGSMALYRSGSQLALARAQADADQLLALRSADSMGRRGWPYVQALTAAAKKCGIPGALDAFGDGTCNPPETPYMIDTGYAVACLAQVAAVTAERRYLLSAIEAVSDSWELGVTGATCPGSFDYWYSYHPNDFGRFVRNVNAIMGVGLTWLYDATGDVKYRNRALAIARTEHCEISAGNYGYFGIADRRYGSDPKLESRRIENHIPHQVKFLQLVAAKFNEPAAQSDAKALLEAFLTCTEPHCRPNNCAAWAVPAECRASQNIAPCMDTDDDRWRSACAAARTRFPRLNGFQIYLMEPVSARPVK